MMVDRATEEAMRANAAAANDRADILAELKKLGQYLEKLNRKLDLLQEAVDTLDLKVTTMGQGLGL
jgi:lambda repressor-like predicted transcriptional regulator